MAAPVGAEDESAQGDLANESGALAILNPDAQGERAQRLRLSIIKPDHRVERVDLIRPNGVTGAGEC